MAFKGSHYVGSQSDAFGGFYKESKQPKPAWGGGGEYKGNKGSAGDPASKKNSMFGKKWTPTCKSCGGKM